MKALPCYNVVDAHVHIHPDFELNRLVLIGLQNFRSALHNKQIYEPFNAFMLLTESEGVHCFAQLRALVGSSGSEHDFTVSATAEECSLRITTHGGQHLFVVNGRQIVTAEKLEVLALGLNDDYADGNPLCQVVEDLAPTGCLQVIPWGAGKWLGKRGRLLEDFVDNCDYRGLFLGDNGNRPKFWHKPDIFTNAEKREIFNLPGSDPLPFDDLEKRAGSSGFVIKSAVDENTPFTSLAAHIREQPADVKPYVDCTSLQNFLKYQLAMQLKNRF